MTPETINSPGTEEAQAVNVDPSFRAFEAARATYAEATSWGAEPEDALASAIAAYHTNFILPPNVAEIVDKLKPAHGICPFCRCDPYHFVDNGVGFEAVAVTCCERGIALFQHGDEELLAEVALREQAASLILSQSAEIERLDKKIAAACQWYWPEDDTSSDACSDNPREALEYHLKPGEIAAYSCGGVVYTNYYGWLPPADDADSDDDFEVDEPTEELATAKMKAEQDRRAAREWQGR